jgi:hypothetical protein
MANAERRREAWRAELDAHGRALAAFLAAAEAVPDAAWEAPWAEGKWTRSQVAEHVRLTYAQMLGEIGGGPAMRVRTPWLKRQVLRLLVMPWIVRRRRMPKGAPAVREIRPGDGPFDRARVLAGLRDAGERLLAELGRIDVASFGGLTHPFFGRMEPLLGLRLLTVHTDHHRAQIDRRAA